MPKLGVLSAVSFAIRGSGGAPKLWLGVAIAWIAWLIDLIPEFVRWRGRWTMRSSRALVLRHPLRRTPQDVVVEHWRGAW